jgi:Tol biopolymer transport system component
MEVRMMSTTATLPVRQLPNLRNRVLGRVICGALMVQAVLGAPLFAKAACASPDDPKVTYVTDDPDNFDYGPQFSPDSQRLIFERWPISGSTFALSYATSMATGTHDIGSVPIEGGKPRPFLKEKPPVSPTRLRWSSVSNRIAFTAMTPQGGGATWLMEGDGTHLRPAPTPTGTNTAYPSWYADGARIVEMDAVKLALRIVDLRTGIARQLTTTPSLLTGMPSASPDGKWIAVAAQRDSGQRYNQSVNQIWLVSETGDAHPLEKGEMQGRAPTWSPDGSRVIFESGRDCSNGNHYAIFVANKDGTDVQRLTPYDDAEHPVWSPDGRWIAFSATQAKAGGQDGSGIAIIAAPAPAH